MSTRCTYNWLGGRWNCFFVDLMQGNPAVSARQAVYVTLPAASTVMNLDF